MIGDNEFYCPKCGKITKSFICCSKEMERDGDIMFCSVCGKERPVPRCCGAFMIYREKEKSV